MLTPINDKEPIPPWALMETCADPEPPRKLTLKEWMDKVIPKLCEYMYLTAWRITVDYLPENDKENTLMSIATDDAYMMATITMRPCMGTRYEQKDGESLGLDMVHEMAHILTDPLYKIATNAITNNEIDWLDDLRENTTQRVALAIWRGVPAELFSKEKMTE